MPASALQSLTAWRTTVSNTRLAARSSPRPMTSSTSLVAACCSIASAQVPRELLDARVDGCSGFLVGGHGSSRWDG